MTEAPREFKPTVKMASAARRGLRLRERFGRGGTDVGLHRAEQLARIPSPGGEVDGQLLQLAAHFLSVVHTSDFARCTAALDAVNLLFGTACPADRKSPRHEIVAAVTVLDLDNVARRAQVVNGSSQDEFHASTFLIVSCSRIV